MATTTERLGIVETKVENLNEKLDGLKEDVKDMHDCLDNTRDSLTDKLNEMYNASCTQHAELAKKIGNLEQIRQKMIWMAAGAVAFAGILSGHFEKNVKDHHSRYGLIKMVSRRKRLLKHLQRETPEKYQQIIARLDLRK